MKTAFHVVFTGLALNFILPALVYAVAPDFALQQFSQVGVALGSGEMPGANENLLWRVLAVANVLTLGFCCVLIQLDIRRWFPVLTPLLFLKACAAIGFAITWGWTGYAGYGAAAALDGVTCWAMWFFATRYRRSLGA